LANAVWRPRTHALPPERRLSRGVLFKLREPCEGDFQREHHNGDHAAENQLDAIGARRLRNTTAERFLRPTA